jgi:hypothetical protein
MVCLAEAKGQAQHDVPSHIRNDRLGEGAGVGVVSST